MIATSQIEELPFETYTGRQYAEVSPARVLECALAAKPSPYYPHINGHWVPQPYPGMAVLSMVGDNPDNEGLTPLLESVQSSLPSFLYRLPPESFHQTVANFLSEDRFLKNIVEPDLESEFAAALGDVFAGISEDGPAGPVCMKLIGLSIFGTALGVLGVFEESRDFEQILQFRLRVYSALGVYGIRRTRPFIGHITLAYCGTELDLTGRETLAAAVRRINQEFFDSRDHCFLMSQCGLRRYDTLSAFRAESHFPTYTF